MHYVHSVVFLHFIASHYTAFRCIGRHVFARRGTLHIHTRTRATSSARLRYAAVALQAHARGVLGRSRCRAARRAQEEERAATKLQVRARVRAFVRACVPVCVSVCLRVFLCVCVCELMFVCFV